MAGRRLRSLAILSITLPLLLVAGWGWPWHIGQAQGLPALLARDLSMAGWDLLNAGADGRDTGRATRRDPGRDQASAGLVLFVQPLILNTSGRPGTYSTSGAAGAGGQPAVLLVIAPAQTQLHFMASPVTYGASAGHSVSGEWDAPSLDIRYQVVGLLNWPGEDGPGGPGQSSAQADQLRQRWLGEESGLGSGPRGLRVGGTPLGEFWPAGPQQSARDLVLDNVQYGLLLIHATLQIPSVAAQPAGEYQGQITVLVDAPVE